MSKAQIRQSSSAIMRIDDDHEIKADHILGRVFITPSKLSQPSVWTLEGMTRTSVYDFKVVDQSTNAITSRIKLKWSEDDLKII